MSYVQETSVNKWLWHIVVVSCLLCMLVEDVASQCEPVANAQHHACTCKAGSFTFSLDKLVFERPNPLYAGVPVTGAKAGTDKSKYTYNPCTAVAVSNCKDSNVAICQETEKNEPFTVGDAPTKPDVATGFYVGDPTKNTLNLTYKHSDGITNREAHVMIRCAKKTKFTALGEVEVPEPNNFLYVFLLETNLACQSGTSVGTILLILFFVSVFAYLVGGVLYMRFARGARGVEQIPNLEFWKGLPGAAKDGVAYVMSGCKADTTYQQI